MNFKLENNLLEVSLKSEGAELTSIKNKSNNVEYLWTGDSNYWGRHAPILFPIVGRVKNNTYSVETNEYHLTQHGFARDMNFEGRLINDASIEFTLNYNEDTLKLYPYKFILKVKYTLEKNKILVNYSVLNSDDKNIYFSIGAHPGFNCPLLPNESFDDYYLEFERKEVADIMILNEDGLFTHNKLDYLKNDNIIKLNNDVFKNDALVFENLDSNKITLKSNKSTNFVALDFSEFPTLGIWSKPTGAPFICIEPWFGHADFEDFHGKLKDKAGTIELLKESEFSCNYSIELN